MDNNEPLRVGPPTDHDHRLSEGRAPTVSSRIVKQGDKTVITHFTADRVAEMALQDAIVSLQRTVKDLESRVYALECAGRTP